MGDSKDLRRLVVTRGGPILVISGLWAAAGAAKAQEATPKDAGSPQTQPWAPGIKRPVPGKRLGPPRTTYRIVTRDGNTVLVPEGDSQEFGPAPPHRPYVLHGRARAIKELLEGDPTAWAVLLGSVGAVVLAFVVSLAFRGPLRTDPDEIVVAWEKQRTLCLVSAFAGIPGALVLAIVLAVATDSPLAFALGFCPIFFVMLVINLAKWRCPACGSGLGRSLSPSFCPKCGAALQEAGRPAQGTATATPREGNHDEQRE